MATTAPPTPPDAEARPRSPWAFAWSPKWIAGHLIAAVAIVTFLNLGFWQLRRLDDRRAFNTKIGARLLAEPTDLATALRDAGADVEALDLRRVVVTGAFRPQDEILAVNRSPAGRSGHYVVTPLEYGPNQLVLVVRGWVPPTVAGPPVTEYPPPPGEVTVTGYLRKPETRGGLGVPDPDGRYRRTGRLDPALLGGGMGGSLAPVVLYLESSEPPHAAPAPIPVPPPEITEGPHLSYAVQWFIFAAVTLIGYPILLWRTAHRRRTR